MSKVKVEPSLVPGRHCVRSTCGPADASWAELGSFGLDSAWLTKLVLNPAHREVRDALRDVNTMHQTLTKIVCPADFGPGSRAAAGMLYRIDQTAAGITILLQSRMTLDPARLPPGFAHAGSRDLAPLLACFSEGMRVRYRMVANATKSDKPIGTKTRGVLRPLSGTDAVAWWDRKAPDAGLTLESEAAGDTLKLTGFRPRDKRKIVITATLFEGTARIDSVPSLHAAILTGVGRGRAYGCGLLSIAPLQ